MLPNPADWIDKRALADEVGRALVSAARKASPVKTGKLRDGWKADTMESGGSVILSNPVAYSEFHPKVAAAALEAVDIPGIIGEHIAKRKGR